MKRSVLSLILVFIMIFNLGFSALAATDLGNPDVDTDTGSGDFNIDFDALNKTEGSETNPIKVEKQADMPAILVVPSNGEMWYEITTAMNGKYITINGNANTVVSLNGMEYLPNAQGVIQVKLDGKTTNKLQVSNIGSSNANWSTTVGSPVGSQENPKVISTIGSLTSLTVAGHDTLYVQFDSALAGKELTIAAAEGLSVSCNGEVLTADERGYVTILESGTAMVTLTNTNDGWITVAAKLKVVQPEVVKFDIDVARMILGNALEFQFGVSTTKIPDKTGYYAVIEKSWADGTITTKTVPAEQWGTAGTYHAVVYDGLAAKEMGDTFYVTIYNAQGVAVSNAREDSVRAYVARAFATQTGKGKTMLVDMLNYGAAAQNYFNYNTGDLANNQLTDAQKACGTKTAAATANKLVQGANYKGTRLVLVSRIQMQIAFTGVDRTMYAQYTYTDHNGKIQSVFVTGEEFVKAGDLYAVELNKLVYSDARQLVTIQLYDSEGKLLSTVQDSIESYVNRSDATTPLFECLMKFADSAKAYLHQ